jgi:hypothetical protein
MPGFYEASPWIPQHFLFTNPNLHHGLFAFDGRAFAIVERVPASFCHSGEFASLEIASSMFSVSL